MQHMYWSKYTKEAATHQFELHDAHAVSEDVGRRPQQLCESIQCVVFEGRTSNLERGRKMDRCSGGLQDYLSLAT